MPGTRQLPPQALSHPSAGVSRYQRAERSAYMARIFEMRCCNKGEAQKQGEVAPAGGHAVRDCL